MVNRNQSENAGLTNQDLQAGTYLVKDYKEIILSQDVLEKVISNLKLEQSGKGLSKKIQVTVPVDTRIVSIVVRMINQKKPVVSQTLFVRWLLKKLLKLLVYQM